MGATSLLNFVLVSDNITIKIYDLAYWSSDKKNEIEGLFARTDVMLFSIIGYWIRGWYNLRETKFKDFRRIKFE